MLRVYNCYYLPPKHSRIYFTHFMCPKEEDSSGGGASPKSSHLLNIQKHIVCIENITISLNYEYLRKFVTSLAMTWKAVELGVCLQQSWD